MFEDVEKYQSLGWYLFPCVAGGKEPACANGQNDATTDLLRLKDWWHTNPNYNVGVFCRRSGFFVIDIDPRSGGFESFDKFEALLEGNIPPTVEAQTGIYSMKGREVRGRQLYYKYDGNEALVGNLKAANLPGIDIKHNGYVIIPPSTHPSGIQYSWKPGHAPWEMAMAGAPEEMLAALRRNSASRSQSAPMAATEMTALIASSTGSTEWGAAALLSELESLRNTPEGGRNNALFAAGCRISELIAGGQLEGDRTMELLVTTAREIGLDDAEIQEVLFRPEGAMSRGFQNPRKPQEVTLNAEIVEFARRMGKKEPAPGMVSGSSAVTRARIIDWEALFSSAEEAEDWFVPGFICSKRNHSLYSDAGLGKSLLMREIAAGLASGRQVLGYPAFSRRVKVLYLDYENNPFGDIKTSLRDMGFVAADLEGYLFLASFPDFAELDTLVGAAQLIDVVDEIQPELVIIDTVSRVISGKENENDTWLRFYNFLLSKLKQREIAVIRLDHEGKNAEAGARGGSAKRGDVDLVWHYERKGAKFKMSCEKSRGTNALEWFEVTRFTNPHLHHSVTKTSDGRFDTISDLLERAQPYLQAERIIRESIEANDGQLVGQSAMWRKLRDEFSDEGVSKRVFEEMHRSIK